MKDQSQFTPGRVLMAATRIWLPLLIAVGGVVLIVLGHASLSTSAGSDPVEAGTGVALLIVAVIVWMINWMFRMSVDSERDREREETAREYFDRHGRWPDEEPR
jgi:membrane protein implicated in regulation of membrane protease activity